MITSFQAKNFKALRDVSLDLTPIHVLIGPNDSGKTSLFEALTALHHTVQQGMDQSFLGRWDAAQLVWGGNADLPVSLAARLKEANVDLEYSLSCRFEKTGRQVLIAREEAKRTGREGKQANLQHRGPNLSAVAASWSNSNDVDNWITKPIHDALARLHLYRWVPSHLSMPVSYNFSPRFSMDTSGFGLPTLLSDIWGEDHARFGQLEERFRKFFPEITSLKLRREQAYTSWRESQPSSPGWALYCELKEPGLVLPAWQASDGLMLVLAYLAILYSPQPPRLLLIEEPENGIHPLRLAQVLDILKELVQEQNKTQVILTTHSPYVVDRFRPEEITLCLKGQDGAVTTRRLSESKPVREQIDIFQLGEIWTAEGDEALAEQATSP
jgi:predicted ATPase